MKPPLATPVHTDSLFPKALQNFKPATSLRLPHTLSYLQCFNFYPFPPFSFGPELKRNFKNVYFVWSHTPDPWQTLVNDQFWPFHTYFKGASFLIAKCYWSPEACASCPPSAFYICFHWAFVFRGPLPRRKVKVLSTVTSITLISSDRQFGKAKL